MRPPLRSTCFSTIIQLRPMRCSSSAPRSSICSSFFYWRCGFFTASYAPFASLVMVLGLRQFMQASVALPAPPGAIWHNPGVPSLLVTQRGP
jgi:hypothetical protein